MTELLLALVTGCETGWADFAAATWRRLGDLSQCLQEVILRFHRPHDVQRSLGCLRGACKELEDILQPKRRRGERNTSACAARTDLRRSHARTKRAACLLAGVGCASCVRPVLLHAHARARARCLSLCVRGDKERGEEFQPQQNVF